MASERTFAARPAKPASGGPILYVVGVLALLGLAMFGYLQYTARHKQTEVPLTPEAKAYVRSLVLSDVGIKATDSFANQTVVEIEGNIGNNGERNVDAIEIYCNFYDRYGQLVLRERLPIVSAKMGGLKPGETKAFRLPFDQIPSSWNNGMPQLVIAAIKFS